MQAEKARNGWLTACHKCRKVTDDATRVIVPDAGAKWLCADCMRGFEKFLTKPEVTDEEKDSAE